MDAGLGGVCSVSCRRPSQCDQAIVLRGVLAFTPPAKPASLPRPWRKRSGDPEHHLDPVRAQRARTGFLCLHGTTPTALGAVADHVHAGTTGENTWHRPFVAPTSPGSSGVDAPSRFPASGGQSATSSAVCSSWLPALPPRW